MSPQRKRQRTLPESCHGQPAPSTIQDGPSPQRLWLDSLPHEVCERIAQHACNGHQNSEALFLAQTSPTQRLAVINVLDRRLFVPCGTARRSWIDVFGNDLIDVRLGNLINRAPMPFTLPLLSLPKVRVVEINDHPGHLAAVARSTSITELSITVRGRTSAVLLFEALSKLKLSKLKLWCQVLNARNTPCTFHDEKAFPPDSDTNAMATCCPHLKSLKVDCLCLWGVVHPVWKVLPMLKALREMTISVSLLPIPDDAFHFLSTLESVKISHVEDGYSLALQIGASVTELKTRFCFPRILLSEAQLVNLARLPHLQTLQCEIEDGAEIVLPAVANNLPALRCLDLLWHQLQRRYRGKQGRTFYPGIDYLYTTAAPLVLLRTVELARNLSELSLARVRIGVTELMAILISVGQRLRRFSTCVADQEEAPWDRLDMLMCTAAEFNPELREFYLLDGTPKRSATPIERQMLRERALEMHLTLQRLERGAPLLATHCILSFMQYMLR